MSSHIYTMGKQLKNDESSPLLYVSESTFENDWISIPHAHSFMELFFVIDGAGLFEIDGQSFPIHKNDLIILAPNVLHTEYSNEKSPLSYIVLDVNAMEIGGGDGASYYVYNISEYKEQIRFCFKTILSEARYQPADYEQICHNLFLSLIGYISRVTHKELIFASASKQKISKECRFIEQYINEHYAENITLDKLSELTYLNKYYLTHLFREYRGESPISYLINLRIKRAKFLLKTTNITIAQIAIATGFSSTSYFSQLFHKKVGESPNRYRKTHNENKG